MDTLTLMRTFVRVVEAGSFTAVARELHTSQPTVSRQVVALEDRLGARLLTRTTRALTPTDDGRIYYDHAVRVLETVDEAEHAVGRRRAKPTGQLRLSIPIVFGRLHVVPRLPRFLARNPDVTLDLVMNDGFSDLVEHGIDLAIRVGEVSDPGLVTRRIGLVRRVTVASPDYLAERGTLATPHDLRRHDCIVYTRLATRNRWHFETTDGPLTVDVKGRYQADTSEAIREGVLAGLGIAVIPAFAFAGEIADGRVVELLCDYEPKPLPMQAIYPSRRLVPLKVRAMIDFLIEELRTDPLIWAGAHGSPSVA
jgi:DNA-binding transcriptional LysR family regulator